MTRDEIQQTVTRVWRARSAGDNAALQALLADGAVYELVGAAAFADREEVGPGRAGPAIPRLVADFTFHSVDTLSAVIEGHKAAMTHRAEVSFRGGPRFGTEFCDMWEFDASGQAASLRQFADTDLIRRMIQGK